MSNINFKIENGVGIITLNRPDKFNSFVRQMALDLQTRLDECEKNSEVRAIYLIGEGKAFCAGQDLAEAIDPNQTDLDKIVEEHYNPIIERLRNIEKPIVCAVNGVAAGAGANLALACDITIAAKSASFIQAFSKIGLIPDSGGTYYLPRLVGMQKSAALMFLGDKVMAEDAEKMGMIYKAVADENLQEEALKIAQTLAKMPTKGIGLTKRLLNESYHNNLTQQLALENELQTIAGSTYDYNEGVNAFLEKRKPNFKGE
ncbi:MAG: 2-(1,2-epoxy-1,2-dihydrophenyl)acetyl-CoA isomerase [Flavobacteriales bacterium CG_4_10_14_0_2_um_filter_32_8]|nr:MAG: 2-(1,2-epoxy-1,2-dihydrophenyl)acetyl-CoA isomerase [Flavobacteriales bacterium CG_4_10_14_0_2_um_filter_32_8]